MSTNSEYTPPKVWTWEKASGGTFANINRPIAGATHEKNCPWASTRYSSIRKAPRTARRLRSCWRSCWLSAMAAPNTMPG